MGTRAVGYDRGARCRHRGGQTHSSKGPRQQQWAGCHTCGVPFAPVPGSAGTGGAPNTLAHGRVAPRGACRGGAVASAALMCAWLSWVGTSARVWVKGGGGGTSALGGGGAPCCSQAARLHRRLALFFLDAARPHSVGNAGARRRRAAGHPCHDEGGSLWRRGRQLDAPRPPLAHDEEPGAGCSAGGGGARAG